EVDLVLVGAQGEAVDREIAGEEAPAREVVRPRVRPRLDRERERLGADLDVLPEVGRDRVRVRLRGERDVEGAHLVLERTPRDVEAEPVEDPGRGEPQGKARRL